MSDKPKAIKGAANASDEFDYSAGLAVIPADKIEDPGLEPHHVRMTDKSKKHEKAAARQVALLFFVSIFGSASALVIYFLFPLSTTEFGPVRENTFWLGLAIALGALALGIGAVHWAKTLMPAAEQAEARHQTRGSEETRARAVEIIKLADQESGFSRRKLIRRSLYTALAFFPLPGILVFGDLGPNPGRTLRHTKWAKGVRLVHDPYGAPILASDVTEGSVFHVVPANINPDDEDYLEQKSKAAVLLVGVNPEDLTIAPDKKGWDYNGIVAYSKICTHVGCPVALFEQDTHHLLCPCHQSTFDLNNGCAVIFGPASRPLPQLPITVDKDGYLIAQSDFLEPVGPSFWDRSIN